MANGTAARRAGWTSVRGPCGRRDGCRTRSRARRAPSAARCAPRVGRRAWRWPGSSRCGRARRHRAPRRTACRRWPGLRRTGRSSRQDSTWTARARHAPAPRYRARMQTPLHPRGGFGDAMVAAVLAEVIASGARVFAISGVQGSGKSTLAAQLARQPPHAAADRGAVDRRVYLDHDAAGLGPRRHIRCSPRAARPARTTWRSRSPPWTRCATPARPTSRASTSSPTGAARAATGRGSPASTW